MFVFILLLNLTSNFCQQKIITLDIVEYFWGFGDWGWGLGIGDWAQSPIPNPQSPIPNPQSPRENNSNMYVL